MSGSPSARQGSLSDDGRLQIFGSPRGEETTSLSCPIRSFRKLNRRARKNWTPETQCLALFQKNFELLTSRLILRFPQFFTFVGGWGGGGILFPFLKVTKFLSRYQSTYCVIIGHFPTVSTLTFSASIPKRFLYIPRGIRASFLQ